MLRPCVSNGTLSTSILRTRTKYLLSQKQPCGHCASERFYMLTFLGTFDYLLSECSDLLTAAFWTSIRISPCPLARCGDAPAYDQALLQSLDRVQFAADCRPRQHAAWVLAGGCRYPAPPLQGGLGETK